MGAVIRVALYLESTDQFVAPNQHAALVRYAEKMGWTVVLDHGNREALLAAARAHVMDLVLSWRTDELSDPDVLAIALREQSVELLALAQSCAALPE